MPKVCFKDSKFSAVDISSKKPLLQQLQELKIPIASSCGGEGTCNKCVVEVLEGEKNLSKETALEKTLKNKFRLSDKHRISCQTYVLGSITITTSYW